MQNSKLTSLFRSFSKDEWRSFEKYLHSPYLNTNQRLIPFYGLLKKHHPSFDHAGLAKATVFASLFPEKKGFDDRLLRATMSDLHKAAESFLIHEKLKEDGRTQRKLLIRSYGNRDQYPRFERLTSSLLETIASQKVKSMDDYLDAFLLNKDHHFHPRTEALTTSVASLKNAVRSLDQFYALVKLRLSCELSARSNIVAEKTEYPMLDAVRQHIEDHLPSTDPTFGIYINLLKINMEGLTEERFFNLKNHYLSIRERLGFQEQKETLIYLLNYANRLGQRGDRLFFNELFELQKTGLDAGLLLENGHLPGLTFTNIAATGASIGQWGWVARFIEDHSHLLPPDIAVDATSLALAYLHFHQGKYEGADGLLAQITTNRFEYRIQQYALSIRCLYEIALHKRDFAEVLASRLLAYEKYLMRQSIFADQRVAANVNFVKTMKKMASALSDGQWPSREETENTSPLISKKWLLSKLDEIAGLKRKPVVERLELFKNSNLGGAHHHS